MIVGGPPCQGFSPLGRDRDDVSRASLNELWQHYLRAVRQVQPLAFVIENVPKFQPSAQFAKLLQLMETDRFLKKYKFAYGVLNAADYGVPRSRRRGIFVAVQGREEVPWPPPPTHGPNSADGRPYVTVQKAFSTPSPFESMPDVFDIGVDAHGRQDLHFRRRPRPESLERYMAVPPGGNRFDLARNRPDLTPRCWANKPTGTTDVIGRLWWDRPSVTIRNEFFKPEKGATCTQSRTGPSPTARRPVCSPFPTRSSSRAPRPRSPDRLATQCRRVWEPRLHVTSTHRSRTGSTASPRASSSSVSARMARQATYRYGA